MTETSTVPEPTAAPAAHPGAAPTAELGPEAGPRSGDEIGAALEAVLLLADEPRRTADLAAVVGEPESVVAGCLAELVAFYDETGRGFELRQVGGGWRYYTREEHADLIAAAVVEGQSARLSQAALETLAVIAYTQPISRGRVSAVRGVNVDGVIRTLLARGLIEEGGVDPESGALVFVTTSHFLERMGLRVLEDLPPLAPHLPEVELLEAELGQLAADDPGSGSPEPATPDAASPHAASDEAPFPPSRRTPHEDPR